MRKEDVPLFISWEEAERPYPWLESSFQEALAGQRERGFVVEDNGVPRGFAVVQWVDNEAYLLNIMVDRLSRQRGFGRLLIDEIEAWLSHQGIYRFFLEVDPANKNAFQFYERRGFTCIQIRKGAYPRGETACLFQKNLPS